MLALCLSLAIFTNISVEMKNKIKNKNNRPIGSRMIDSKLDIKSMIKISTTSIHFEYLP